MNRLLLIALLFFFVSGCQSSDDSIERPDVSGIPVDVDIIRLEQELFSATSKDEIRSFLEQNKLFAQNFLFLDQYPHDSIVVNQLYALINNPSLDTVYQESQQVFGDMEQIRQDFATAFKFIKYHYPEFEPPVIYTMVTGFGNDMYVSEDMIVIGLDYFLGEGATYRPLQLPDYILRRYSPDHLVPSTILLLSQEFNKVQPDDKSMLADMIYYGKSFYFTEYVLPEIPDSLIIGYTAEEMKGLWVNEKLVWNHFLKNELLYETNHIVKKKYIDERPATLEVGNKAPGRLAQWLGWQLVRAYMNEKEEVSLPELMATVEPVKILEESDYDPE
ncbi:gliding motility lipoprotein GldB [Nafulsella turpanensis]|uniref:gliding motility lipoprotein GldB n=1 Tax=Nafulsella turpanensis TaxID=1265690 RepID=UPI001268C917|nr:gliding motility lipoprotein GldB [Nafulsella turpanensis]